VTTNYLIEDWNWRRVPGQSPKKEHIDALQFNFSTKNEGREKKMKQENSGVKKTLM
jgi:hypothetical protein